MSRIKGNGEMRYPFKRNFYYKIESAIATSCVCFLLGPRKCGKTVALKQLEHEMGATYINFKTISEKDSSNVFDSIISSMKNDEKHIFLLDEITYAFHPEREINKIAIQLAENSCKKTKVVFTGSQSVALETWANRAFCGNAAIIRTDFLNYNEWLRYENIYNSSESSYLQFLLEVDKFYGFLSLEDYLRGCLEETIISNNKTDNIIMGNDVYLIDVDTLIDICYATLFTLHNHVSVHKFASNNKLNDSIRYYFKDVCNQIGIEEIGNRIADSFIGKYNDFRSKELNTLKQSFLFLQRCGLITITPISDSVETIPNVNKDLSLLEPQINYKDELFNKFNVCIKYPMFYVAILKDILKESFPNEIPTALLGSIVECHVRGLLSENSSFEYEDIYGHEVDYVNVQERLAIEMTVSNKRSNEFNFNLLPDDYKQIVLTKNIFEKNQKKIQIPYYDFIKIVSENCTFVTNKKPLFECVNLYINIQSGR